MPGLRLFLCSILTAGLVSAQPEKVIFDTDSAYFNDDGAALVMLLQRPQQVEVVGLTLVPGNVWPMQGAEYMLHILKVMKRPAIPVHLGAQAPLVHTRAMAQKENREYGPAQFIGAFESDPPRSRAQLEAPFGGKFSGLSPARKHAVDFLIDTLDASPGQVTVLELGPMTNLAMALRLRPDLETKIRRLVFMGGSLRASNHESWGAEFNFWFDPEAAQVVLRSAIAKKAMIGLDITNGARIEKKHFDQIVAAKTAITDIFREDMGNRFPGFFKKPDTHTYAWDALAAAYLLDPRIVTKRETAYLDVDTRFSKTYGAVIPLDRTLTPQATPVEVMLDLDFARFFALYKELLTKQP